MSNILRIVSPSAGISNRYIERLLSNTSLSEPRQIDPRSFSAVVSTTKGVVPLIVETTDNHVDVESLRPREQIVFVYPADHSQVLYSNMEHLSKLQKNAPVYLVAVSNTGPSYSFGNTFIESLTDPDTCDALLTSAVRYILKKKRVELTEREAPALEVTRAPVTVRQVRASLDSLLLFLDGMDLPK